MIGKFLAQVGPGLSLVTQASLKTRSVLDLGIDLEVYLDRGRDLVIIYVFVNLPYHISDPY